MCEGKGVHTFSPIVSPPSHLSDDKKRTLNKDHKKFFMKINDEGVREFYRSSPSLGLYKNHPPWDCLLHEQ